jgi:hypothetical protein
MIAGVDDNIKFAGGDDNIKIAGVARNTTNNNNISTSKWVEFSKDEPPKTLVELMKNHTQAKNWKKTSITLPKSTHKKMSIWQKNTKNKEIKEETDNREFKVKNNLLNTAQQMIP